MGWGIGLGAAVQSGLNVYKTFKDVESQGLRDKLTEQQIQKNQIDLETEQGRQKAMEEYRSITERYLGGGVQSAPSPDGGPQGPGDAPNVQRPVDFGVFSDPVQFAQMERDLARPAMKMFKTPQEGIAFMKANRDAVENFVPQAGLLLANGDVEGAKKMLRASGGRYAGVVDIVPVQATADSQEGPTQTPRTLYKLDFGEKGATVIDPQVLVEYTKDPTKYIQLTKEKKAEARADKTLEIAATDSQNRGLATAATIRKTDAEIANMPKELDLKERTHNLAVTVANNNSAFKGAELGLKGKEVANETTRANAYAESVKEQAKTRAAVEELNKMIKESKDASDAQIHAAKFLDNLSPVDEGTGKKTPSALNALLPGLMDKVTETAKTRGVGVGVVLQPELDKLLGNAEAVGGQLAAAAAKDDKGASLAFEVADALKQNISAREIRAYAGHKGIPESKINKAIAAAKEALKKEKDAPAKGLGIGARPAPVSSAAAPLPPELESARQLSDRMAAEEAARRRAKHEVPAGQGLGGYVPVDELTAQPQRAGFGLGR